ncbi:MAG: S41 family peptidase [Candidatus Omnitrophica bacterium]|nr:S41 family peptidase [Candidatus Omnitrophota bacterium]
MFKKALVVILFLFGLMSFATYARSQSDKATAPVKAAGPVVPAVLANVTGNTEEVKKDEDAGPQDLYSQVELFSYVLTTVQSEYVVEKKPKELIYGALTGMVGALDPHSQFLPPDEYKDLKTETEGKFGGLGIEITTRDGLLTIVTPIEDTPAWKAGLKAGDRIVKIEKKITRDMTLNEAVKQLRGEPGTKVHITILRESEFKVHDYEIVREIIHVKDVKEPLLLDDNIAYVRLVEFRENSYEQIYAAIKKLKDQGATSLILDVRNNPGGLLNVAIKISEMFLPAGKTIVSTRGRHKEQDTVSVSHNVKNEFADWPIVILINEGSASGSEILAGALKDNRRAVTLGVKSFGKGSVQSVIPLPDGSGLRLTTSKYFTPSGVCIHDIGITPDIVIPRIFPKGDADSDEEDGTKDSKDVKNIKDAKKSSNDVFEKLEEENIQDPNMKEKRRKELEVKKRMAEDNQVQGAINVIKGIRVYKKLTVE